MGRGNREKDGFDGVCWADGDDSALQMETKCSRKQTRLILTLNLQTQNGASTVQTLYNTRVVVVKISLPLFFFLFYKTTP